MSDPGKVIVAVSFFGTIAYIVRLLVLNAKLLADRTQEDPLRAVPPSEPVRHRTPH
jgi:hypothetical protein